MDLGGRRICRLAAALALLGTLTASAIVAAQTAQPTAEDIKRAGESFDLGKRAYRNEDWVEAAEHFEAADQRAPSAVALELALRSRARAEQLDRAATLASLALERHPDQQKLAKLAKDVLKKAEKELHRVSVKCSEPCDLVVDSKLVHGRAAEKRVVFLSPGDYTLRAGWPGERAASEKVTATKGGKSELSFTAPPEKKASASEPGPALGPSPTPSPTPKPDQPRTVDTDDGGWSPVVFWIGTGLTVAAGAATAWSGIDTQNNPGPDRVREECAGQGESCDLYQEGLDKQNRTNILAGVTAGLGVATILVGLFATDWGGEEATAKRRSPPRAGVRPWIGIPAASEAGVGSGAALGARGRF